jgi:hypothetical protein
MNKLDRLPLILDDDNGFLDWAYEVAIWIIHVFTETGPEVRLVTLISFGLVGAASAIIAWYMTQVKGRNRLDNMFLLREIAITLVIFQLFLRAVFGIETQVWSALIVIFLGVVMFTLIYALFRERNMSEEEIQADLRRRERRRHG